MSMLRKLMIEAAKQAAQNPEVQRKVAEIAGTAYRHAAPKVARARQHVAETFKETREETSPLDHPVDFAKSFGKRLLPPRNEEK